MHKTLYDKLWDSHVARDMGDGASLLYIDRHLVHEVTSPQAFEALNAARRRPWRSETIVASPDHNTPTAGWEHDIADPLSKAQVDLLDLNMAGLQPLAYFPFRSAGQGILHVVAPEIGATLPGTTIVCGDSHTSTHGAFAALAFGIGTSEVEHVLATQTLVMQRSRNMAIEIDGALPPGVTVKDLILHTIGVVGTAGGTGYAIEFRGPTVRRMSMEQRMTMCNMAIEAGARTGLVAYDEVTEQYLRGLPHAPAGDDWLSATRYWSTLVSDPDAAFDRVVRIDAGLVAPQVTWGTSPEMVCAIDGNAADPASYSDPGQRQAIQDALDYMGLLPAQAVAGLPIDQVFIGSCTNARIEDLREAARVVGAGKVAPGVRRALVVPGSGQVKRQAEREGLDQVFRAAGFEWREPGCSMCLAMNDDRLAPGERCASTSNRNFEGRQGTGGRSHLMSPAMAAAAALAGRLVDVRSWNT